MTPAKFFISLLIATAAIASASFLFPLTALVALKWTGVIGLMFGACLAGAFVGSAVDRHAKITSPILPSETTRGEAVWLDSNLIHDFHTSSKVRSGCVMTRPDSAVPATNPKPR
jgi:hypothetical protein